MKIYNKGERVFILKEGRLKPDSTMEFTDDRAKSLLKMYPKELRRMSEDKK